MASFDLSVTADIEGAEQLAGFGRLLRMGRSGVRLACVNAINRSLGHMRSIISAEIRDTYYIKKATLDKGIHVYKARANANALEGVLFAEGMENPHLGNFSPKQGKTYVSVRVLKAHRARRIRPGGIHKIIATSKGRAAVWLAKGHVMARSEEAEHPIILYGPSFMAFFRRPNVVKALNIEARRYYEKRLAQEINHYYGKAVQG